MANRHEFLTALNEAKKIFGDEKQQNSIAIAGRNIIEAMIDAIETDGLKGFRKKKRLKPQNKRNNRRL